MKKESNDYPTEQELKDAGFDGLFIKLNEYVFLAVYRNFSGAAIYAFEDGTFSSNSRVTPQFKPTKANLVSFYKTFTGQPLDFTPKAKAYDWDSVFERMESPQRAQVFNSIQGLERNISNSDSDTFKSLVKKTIAVMKLCFIIEELDRDFEADERCAKYEFYFYEEKTCINTTCLPASSIKCTSKEAAEALLKDNEELIKQALK